MTDKFQNKYRVESNRLPGWDYSGSGLYFVTIVSKSRLCVFGTIKNKKMIFSEFGKIANNEWYKSFEIRKELLLSEFVLMPNHLHAIIILKNKNNEKLNGSPGLNDLPGLRGSRIETHGRASLQFQREFGRESLQQSQRNSNNQSNKQNNFIRKPKSISSFVAGYKSVVINKIDDYIDENNLNIAKYNHNNPLWQSNYHDHIIRNNNEYWRIKNYILNNPKKWDDDKFNND